MFFQCKYRRAGALLAAGVLAAAAPACSDDPSIKKLFDFSVPDTGPDGFSDGSFPNLPGGNPLVPEVAAYPFPSDFYLKEDTTSLTGRRVSIPAEALPKLLTPKIFSEMDGFSFTPPILVYLPGGVDPESLPPDVGETVKGSSPVMLVKEKTWDRVPVLAENDLTAADDKQRSLIIRPLVALEPSTGYVVILRDLLKNLAGETHRANPAFVALRDGIETAVPEIEKQREDFKLVNAAIAGLELDPEEVVLAWSFHTRSEEQVTSTLLKMHEIVDKAPLGDFTIVSDKIEQGGTKKNRQIEATLKVPNFIGNNGRISRDKQGNPVQSGEREVELAITIPSTVDEPRPVILYGHGFFGHWEQGTRSSFNDLCTQYRFSAVSSFIGFSEEIQSVIVVAFGSGLSEFDRIVAENLQTFVNYTALARLVKEKLATELTTDWGNGPVKTFDPPRVQYLGISNGGTFGYVVAATSPQLTRATLVVGGGGLVHFLQRAVQWKEYGALMRVLYPHALDRQLVLSMMQMVLDPIDSMSYARRMVHDRYPGREPLKAAVHMAVHDSQVRNLVTEWVVRTAKIPLITPSAKEIYGLQTITAPPPGGAPAGTMGALFVYDEKVTPAPEGNIPPAEDNDTHGTVRDLQVYQKHVSAFIEDGTLVQVCDGACDPQ
jgi:hypothetical protein